MDTMFVHTTAAGAAGAAAKNGGNDFVFVNRQQSIYTPRTHLSVQLRDRDHKPEPDD